MSDRSDQKTTADSIAHNLFNELKMYRERRKMDKIELLNLEDDARAIMISAGAQLMCHDASGSEEANGIQTLMAIPPEWKLTEDSMSEVNQVFDFKKTYQTSVSTPLLVFSKGDGYDPVCIYNWEIQSDDDTAKTIIRTKVAYIHDYLRNIKSNKGI